MLKKYLLVCIASLFSMAAYATDTDVAGEMHIQISNQTNANCILISKEAVHGKFSTYPAESILMSDSKAFSMHQYGAGFHGSTVIVSYQCGSRQIRFSVGQSRLLDIFNNNPDVHVTTLSANGLTLETANITSASAWWNTSSNASLILKNTSAS